MIQRRISDSPDPAAPVNSGEPLKTIARREPPSSAGFIFEIMCWRKSRLPSLIRGSPAPKRPAKPLVACSVLTASSTFFHSTPNGGIGEQVVEGRALVAVLGEGVAEDDVGGVLALEHHVRAADRVGLGVQLLAEDLQAGVGVEGAQVILGHREHPAGAAGRVEERLLDPGVWSSSSSSMKSRFTIRRITSRGVKCSPAVSLESSENWRIEFLVEVAHLQVRDRVGVQVDVAEPAEHLVEQVGPIELVDLGLEVELVDHVPGARREPGDVGAQVVGEVGRVVEQLGQGQRARC